MTINILKLKLRQSQFNVDWVSDRNTKIFSPNSGLILIGKSLSEHTLTLTAIMYILKINTKLLIDDH